MSLRNKLAKIIGKDVVVLYDRGSYVQASYQNMATGGEDRGDALRSVADHIEFKDEQAGKVAVCDCGSKMKLESEEERSNSSGRSSHKMFRCPNCGRTKLQTEHQASIRRDLKHLWEQLRGKQS